MNSIDYEKSIINAFIVKNKINRYLNFIQKPKTRNKFIDLLNHFNDLNPGELGSDHGERLVIKD